MSMEKEFEIGRFVTLVRYGLVQQLKIVGYGQKILSQDITYKMDDNGVIIESSGMCIMESKYYVPETKGEKF